MMVPVRWSLQRKSSMPIIEVKCESQAKGSEFIIIHHAVEMIEKASKFKGIPYQDSPILSNNFLLTVYFSLIFPSDKELNSFMEAIKKGK